MPDKVYPEELWNLCSAQSLSVCAAAGQESVSLLSNTSNSDYAELLLKSLLRQARLRIPRLPWTCATQLATTVCRVYCIHARMSATSSVPEGSHPIDELLRCHPDLWAPVLAELTNTMLTHVSQNKHNTSNEPRIGANSVWLSIRPWATSVLLQRGDSAANIASLKISLVDSLIRVSWEAIAARCWSQSTTTAKVDESIDCAIVKWLLKTLRGASRAHICDALLVRNTLHHCASLILDDGFGGNNAEALNKWESLLSEFALLCIIMINNEMHPSPGKTCVVPLDLLCTLTRVVSCYPGSILRICGGVLPVLSHVMLKSQRARVRRSLLDLMLACFRDVEDEGNGLEMSDKSDRTSKSTFWAAVWTSSEMYIGACACLCTAMDTSVSDGNNGVSGLAARARVVATKLLGAALFAPEETNGNSSDVYIHTNEPLVPVWLPSPSFCPGVLTAKQLNRFRHELARCVDVEETVNNVPIHAILQIGALLLENDSAFRQDKDWCHWQENEQRHKEILKSAMLMAQLDSRGYLMSIVVFLLGQRSLSASNTVLSSRLAAEYKLSLFECLPVFGLHAFALPLIRRLLSPLLTNAPTCALAIRLFTEVWKVRQESKQKVTGNIFPILERMLEDHCEAREIRKRLELSHHDSSKQGFNSANYVGEVLSTVSKSALMICTMRPGLGGQIVGVLQRLLQCNECGHISSKNKGKVAPLVVSTAIDALSQLCSADCLQFYAALPLLLPSKITSPGREFKGKHPSAVSFHEEGIVARSLASFFAAGVEYTMFRFNSLGSGSNFEHDVVVNSRVIHSQEEAESILGSARGIVSQLFEWAEAGASTAKDLILSSSASKDVQRENFEVAAAALESLCLFAYDFPSETFVRGAMTLCQTGQTSEASSIALENEQESHRTRACNLCLSILTLPRLAGSESMRSGAEALLVELMRGEEQTSFGQVRDTQRSKLRREELMRALDEKWTSLPKALISALPNPQSWTTYWRHENSPTTTIQRLTAPAILLNHSSFEQFSISSLMDDLLPSTTSHLVQLLQIPRLYCHLASASTQNEDAFSGVVHELFNRKANRQKITDSCLMHRHILKAATMALGGSDAESVNEAAQGFLSCLTSLLSSAADHSSASAMSVSNSKVLNASGAAIASGILGYRKLSSSLRKDIVEALLTVVTNSDVSELAVSRRTGQTGDGSVFNTDEDLQCCAVIGLGMLAVSEIISTHESLYLAGERAPMYVIVGQTAMQILDSTSGYPSAQQRPSTSRLNFRKNLSGACAMVLAWICEAFSCHLVLTPDERTKTMLLLYRSKLVSLAENSSSTAIPAISASLALCTSSLFSTPLRLISSEDVRKTISLLENQIHNTQGSLSQAIHNGGICLARTGLLHLIKRLQHRGLIFREGEIAALVRKFSAIVQRRIPGTSSHCRHDAIFALLELVADNGGRGFSAKYAHKDAIFAFAGSSRSLLLGCPSIPHVTLQDKRNYRGIIVAPSTFVKAGTMRDICHALLQASSWENTISNDNTLGSEPNWGVRATASWCLGFLSLMRDCNVTEKKSSLTASTSLAKVQDTSRARTSIVYRLLQLMRACAVSNLIPFDATSHDTSLNRGPTARHRTEAQLFEFQQDSRTEMDMFFASALRCLLTYTPTRTIFGTQLTSVSSQSFAIGSTIRFILGVMSEESQPLYKSFEEMLKSTYTLSMSLACKVCEKDASLTEILVEEIEGISGGGKQAGAVMNLHHLDDSLAERVIRLVLAASPCLASLYRVSSLDIFSSIVSLCIDSVRFSMERATKNVDDYFSRQKHEKIAEFVLGALLEFSIHAPTRACNIISTYTYRHLFASGGRKGSSDSSNVKHASWYTPGAFIRLKPSLWSVFLEFIFSLRDISSSENEEILTIIRENKLVHLASFSEACRYVDLMCGAIECQTRINDGKTSLPCVADLEPCVRWLFGSVPDRNLKSSSAGGFLSCIDDTTKKVIISVARTMTIHLIVKEIDSDCNTTFSRNVEEVGRIILAALQISSATRSCTLVARCMYFLQLLATFVMKSTMGLWTEEVTTRMVSRPEALASLASIYCEAERSMQKPWTSNLDSGMIVGSFLYWIFTASSIDAGSRYDAIAQIVAILSNWVSKIEQMKTGIPTNKILWQAVAKWSSHALIEMCAKQQKAEGNTYEEVASFSDTKAPYKMNSATSWDLCNAAIEALSLS